LQKENPALPAGGGGVSLFGVRLAHRHYALALLTFVYVVNYLDRQILSILLQPIKEEFGVSDTALGFLSGITFAVFYATLGIPIAMLADRFSRKKIIAVSLTLFSVMTVACGMVVQFWQLVLARIGVGIGEAGTSPPSHSIIADLYPPEKRATALAIFSAGLNVGIMIGFFGGGLVNELYGWRVAFLCAGLPGLFLAFAVLVTLKEPQRGHSEGLAASSDAPRFFEVARTLWQQRSFRHIAFGAAMNAFAGYGAVTFTPAFLYRSHGLSTAEIGTALALIYGVAGGAGTFLAGYFADRFSRGGVQWNMYVPAIAILAVVPFGFVFYLHPNMIVALCAAVLPSMAGAVYLGPCLSMTQGLVPLRMRATAAAVLLFVINIIGLGLGPQTVGLVSDLLNPSLGQDSLRWALLIAGVGNIWSALHFYLASRTLKADLAKVRNTVHRA